MNVTCPACEMENAYLEIVDEKGSHYICPDCDYEWCDTSNSAEPAEEFEGDDLKQFKECPNCSKKDFRFVYNCNLCNFTGCYDELNYNGCFEDKTGKVNCPNCGKCDYEIVGKVGKVANKEPPYDFEFQ